MRTCPECVRILRSYKFGLAQRYRLDRKLASAMASFDLQNFEGLSRSLTEMEAALMFLRGRIERHESKTRHNPIAGPLLLAE
jgi:hypothetical protein